MKPKPPLRTLLTKTTVAVGFAAIALAAGAAEGTASSGNAPAVDEHAGWISTQERDCFETADRRPVPIELAQSYVPARYTVQQTAAPPPPAWLGDPNTVVAPVGFVDYVCESLSVNGHAPRPTIVSIGVVQITHRDGARLTRDGRPVTGVYVLWVGTDNPLLFARLQQLGVETYFIPRSSYSEATVMTASGPRTAISVDYVGNQPDGLSYTRSILATEAASTPIRISPSGPAYHMGSEGEVSFSWTNYLQPNGLASVCFELDEGSIPSEYGITSFCFPSPRTFFRGSWDGTIGLLP